MTDNQSDMHLVQRLTRTDRDHKSGLDRLFRMDYMGSSEFEYFGFPAALRAMRARKPMEVVPTEITFETGPRTVYIVAPAGEHDKAITSLTSWVAAGEPGKEWPNFSATANGERFPTDAWWSLKADFAWALDADIAEALRTGLSGT